MIREMPMVVERQYKTSPTSLFTVLLAMKTTANGDGLRNGDGGEVAEFIR
jgi:hypothetical protein